MHAKQTYWLVFNEENEVVGKYSDKDKAYLHANVEK